MRVRTDSRREAILEVAAEVFREAGFERASMAQIAERVGGSKATLYGYFPSKAALFVAAIHAACDHQLRQVAAEMSDTADSLEQALIRFGVRVVAFMAEENRLATYRMVLAEAGRSDVGELFWNAGPCRGQKSLADFLARRMQQGEMRHADPNTAASHLIGLLSAEHESRLFSRQAKPLDSATLQRTVTLAVAVFMGGYRPEAVDTGKASSSAPVEG